MDLDKILELAENMTYDEFCAIKKEKGITSETYKLRTYSDDFNIKFGYYVLEFSYFDGIQWRELTKKITALTEDMIIVQLKEELEYMNEWIDFGKPTKRLKTIDEKIKNNTLNDKKNILDDIQFIDLSTPLIEEIK